MKKWLLLFFASVPIVAVSQSQNNKNFDTCASGTLAQLSYFWKNDSLGNNGFRLYSFNEILKCDYSNLKISDVIIYLGKPNYISIDEYETYNCYFYFNGKAIPNNVGMPNRILFICFSVNKGKEKINKVFIDHYD